MSRPGAPHPVFNSTPDLTPDQEMYFWAYMRLKSRASSMSGIITWADMQYFVERHAAHLDLDLFEEYIEVLEAEDTKIHEDKRPKTPPQSAARPARRALR